MGKRIKSMLIVSLSAAAMVSGCTSQGASGTKQANTDAKSGNSDGKEVVLRIWAAGDWLNGDNSPGMQTIKEFNEKYKGKIRVEGKYAPWSEHNPAMQAAFASHDMPDIFQMPQGSDLNQLINQKLIQPYDGIVSADWSKKFQDGSFVDGVNRIGGKIYTYPLTGLQQLYMLYYNKDVLKNAGLDPDKPPKTWDELRSMAKTVTDKGKGDVFGLTFGGGDKDYTLRAVGGFALGMMPESNDFGLSFKTGKYTFDSKPWSDAVKFLLSMKNDGSILPSSYSLKQAEAGALFGQGKAAFLLDARWRMWQLKRDTPDAKFGMAPVPTQDGRLPVYGTFLAPSSNSMVISATTKHPAEVGKFIEEALASESFYTKYMKSGVALTPMTAVNNNKANYPYPEYADFVKLHDQLLRIMPNPSARNPDEAQVSAELGTYEQSKMKPSMDEVFQMLLMGADTNVDAKLKEMNDKLNKSLQDAIQKVKGKGLNVSPDDFVFPNWEPTKNYSDADYKALK